MRNKKYLPLEPNSSATHLKVEVYYSKGGMNYFTSSNEKRGIYLSVSPVTRRENSESYMGFSGVKKHLVDMARFSQKTFDNFVVTPEIEKELIDHVCQKNGVKVLEVTE
jgi:hypothetical protein